MSLGSVRAQVQHAIYPCRCVRLAAARLRLVAVGNQVIDHSHTS